MPGDMDEPAHDRGGLLPLHRSEALTDGIFAVAMTLLVIELKLPDHGLVHSADRSQRPSPACCPRRSPGR